VRDRDLSRRCRENAAGADRRAGRSRLRVLFAGFYLKVHESRPEPSPVLKRAHAPLPPIASPLVAPQGPTQA